MLSSCRANSASINIKKWSVHVSYWTECLQLPTVLEELQDCQHHAKINNLISTLWTRTPMGCKQVQRKELYWTDKSGCVNCFKEKSYLTCNTSYYKLWPPPPLSVQCKNSALRRRLCHFVNHNGLLLGRHRMLISVFPLLLDPSDRLVLREPRKATHWINTYVLR